jgi:hypothetical protein
VEFSNGIVTNPTFGQYNPLRLNEAPREIIVDFVEDKVNPMGGIGEPAVARGARLTRKTSIEDRLESVHQLLHGGQGARVPERGDRRAAAGPQFRASRLVTSFFFNGLNHSSARYADTSRPAASAAGCLK